MNSTLKIVAVITILLSSASIILPSNAHGWWDARTCNRTLVSGGAIVGGTIGFFGDTIKTFLSGGTTLASDAASGGTATGTALGITAGGAVGEFTSPWFCPTIHRMPTDEAYSLYDVLLNCRNEYWMFMNPLPFTEDTDYCTIPGNSYIRAYDTRALEGYQISTSVLLKKLKYQFDAGIKSNSFSSDMVPIIKAFSEQLRECSKTYHDRMSVSKSDYCVVKSRSQTEFLWNPAGKRVSIPSVLETSLRLLQYT